MKTSFLRLNLLVISFLFASVASWGQNPLIKSVVTGSLDRVTASALQQQLEKQLVSSVLPATINANIYHAMFQMEPGFAQSKPEGQRFPANAFLIKTTYNGKEEVWGVTTRELAKNYGPKVVLRAKMKGKEISFPAHLAQLGPARLSNLALLKVPQDLPREVEPLEVAAQYDHEKPVSLYSFDENKFLRFPQLTLQKDNGYFIRVDLTGQANTPHSLFHSTYGAPLLSNGKAVGVFCNRNANGGYASSLSVLPYLVENAHHSYQTSTIPFKIKNYDFGEIYLDETIFSVSALDYMGNLVGIKFFQKEMHQSDILQFINNPKTATLRFQIQNEEGAFVRALYYNLETGNHWSLPR